MRRISVNGNNYLYTLKNTYDLPTRQSIIRIRLFLERYKATPLQIEIRTWDDPVLGSPLNVGFKLKNRSLNKDETVNINRPRYIRQFILYGVQKGWTRKNNLEKLDGLKILRDLGYDITPLIPHDNL